MPSPKINTSKAYIPLLALWVGLALLFRLLPHPPNLSPFASLIMVLGCHMGRKTALAVTLSALVLSDIMLSLLTGLPLMGLWTFFVYSGFAAIALGSASLLRTKASLTLIAGFAMSSVLAFWLWTNIGTWFGPYYPHTLQGLIVCLTAGLPFLQRSMASAVVFVPLFLLLMRAADRCQLIPDASKEL